MDSNHTPLSLSAAESANSASADSTIPARMRLGGQPMNDIQRQRLVEQRHLAETKLMHIEKNLEDLRGQMQWLRSWEDVRMQLSEEKQRLYELNKQYACLSAQEEELRRFEAFEHMQGCYQRVAILEQESKQNRLALSALTHDDELKQQELAHQQKNEQRAREALLTAEMKLRDSVDNIFIASKLEGQTFVLQNELSFIKDVISSLQDKTEELRAEWSDLTAEIARHEEALERHKTQRQSMESHRRMMERGEEVLIRLKYLRDMLAYIGQLKAQQNDAAQQQASQDALLARVYNQYQKVMEDIETTKNELVIHHEVTHGQERIKLEEKMHSLKKRQHMLLSAQTLWSRISEDIQKTEDKRRKHNELRLQIEHQQRTVQQLSDEASRLAHLFEEKSYTYMLSRSQNVVQLRFDLQEGTACSVCGAIHHPYHCDTPLEQSKLIGEFRTEYEMMQAENKAKQKLLTEQMLSLATMKGAYAAEEDELKTLEERQVQDMREWTHYAYLDASFLDTSITTNLEARSVLLRQFIDSCTRAVEVAEKDLEVFNFHQEQISRLNLSLQDYERHKNEVAQRMVEINTGLQVMAGRVEKLQAQIDYETSRYTETYEFLKDIITLPSWLEAWQANQDNVFNQIVQMLESWRSVEHLVSQEEATLSVLTQRKDAISRLTSLTESFQAEWSKQHSAIDEQVQQIINEHDHLTAGSQAQIVYETLTDELQSVRSALDEQQHVSLQHQMDMQRIRGCNDFHQLHLTRLDKQLSEQRSVLDHFIASYNAHHAPVQYASLQNIFQDGKDWNHTRSSLSELLTQRAISLWRTDRLNSRLVTLQSEATLHTLPLTAGDGEERLPSLIDQYQKLCSKHRDILLHIARINVLLENS